MNFFEYFNIESNITDVFKEFEFDSLDDNIYEYKLYSPIGGENLMDISYRFYDTIDNWWVLYFYNDMKDIMFNVGSNETIYNLVDQYIKSTRYYSGSPVSGSASDAGSGADYFFYTLPLILGDNVDNSSMVCTEVLDDGDYFNYTLPATLGENSVGTTITSTRTCVITDSDGDGIIDTEYYLEKGKLLTSELLRHFFLEEYEYSLSKSIYEANDIMNNGTLYDDQNVLDAFKNYLTKLIIKDKKIFTSIKIPTYGTLVKMKDEMNNYSIAWEEGATNV